MRFGAIANSAKGGGLKISLNPHPVGDRVKTNLSSTGTGLANWNLELGKKLRVSESTN